MRMATNTMMSCKDEIIRMNVKPTAVNDMDRLCTLLRACFAYGSYTNDTVDQFRQSYMHCIDKILHMAQVLNPRFFGTHSVNATAIVEAFTRCSYNLIPVELKYSLAAVSFFKDFVSG
ncbi:uncharacterized protein LOC125756242 [Rhipicephalus sanguineus]|uniref:uncharacterized protein LOC125756242 n=1 Tax=Rhipicephalus sanguineus TaxID=34632 RepID=UPI0020C327AA|nr:uncharacterized protein LOC125756242 [Rhipicephalus sanguineus]